MSNVKLFTLYLVFTICLASSLFVFAGDLLNTSTPVSTSYTITDIYRLIHNNDLATEANHNLYPSSTPTATSSYSISQIYADLANLIKKQDIATDTVYLGVTGDYGNALPETPTTTIIVSSLTPNTSQTEPDSYTLEDIWNLITNNATTTPTSHSFTPDSAPTSPTMHTLTDIYEALVDLGNNKSAEVASGISYLGQVGTYIPLPTESEIVNSLRLGLAGYWPLDNDVEDYSGNNNNGINHSATSTQGRVNQGLDFNGSLIPYVSVADSQSLRVSPDVTISAWIYYKQPAFLWQGHLMSYILEKGSRPAVLEEDNYAFYVIDHHLGFEFTPPGDTLKMNNSVSAALTPDNWYHVAVVFSDANNSVRYYIDGNYIDSKISNFSLDPSLTNSLSIGRQNAIGYIDTFNGVIDEATVWNRSLSDAEIQQLYNNGSGRSLVQ